MNEHKYNAIVKTIVYVVMMATAYGAIYTYGPEFFTDGDEGRKAVLIAVFAVTMLGIGRAWMK